jgi:acyl dehydratase
MSVADAAVDEGAAVFGLWFDELEPGMACSTRARTITETDVVQFAAMSGDRHPVHLDAEWAAGSPFGERIAHGLMVVSYAAGLLPLHPERVVAMRRLERVTFKRPVTIGDTVRVDAKLTELNAVDDATGIVRCSMRILNQHDRCVTQAEIDLIWRRLSGQTAKHHTEEGE